MSDSPCGDCKHLLQIAVDGRLRLDHQGPGRMEWSVDGETPSKDDRWLLNCLWTTRLVIENGRDKKGYPMMLSDAGRAALV